MFVAHLVIKKTEIDGREQLLVNTGEAGLRLEKGKIYTLQGPNGAGKSSLIRAIMGVPQARGREPIAFRLNDRTVSIADVADAIELGLVAVFQDDQLIPTMTVREQLLLRHGGRGFRTLALNLAKKWTGRVFNSRSKDICAAVGLPKSDEEQIIEQANNLLELFDNFHPEASYKNVIEKYPGRLSGGEHAVARLLLSQLTPGIQLLFLDEVFRGVQREVWPRILDAIRSWAVEKQITVLAVSHSDEELTRWRPHGRFEMNRRKLRSLPPIDYDILYPGLPAQTSICAVFDPVTHVNWSDEVNLRGPWIIFCDKEIESSPTFQLVLSQLRGRVLFQRSFEAGENIKSLNNVISMLEELAGYTNAHQSLRGAALLIAGGGTIINWGGFLASVLHRGIPTVLVPSTVMSIADVAIGSKTSINYSFGEESPSHKHVLGTYHNPTAILLDRRILKSLPISERRFGLSECLKHGLLQDLELWNGALETFRESSPNWERCFEIARQTMTLKAHVLSLDPWERSFGRVLLYGHLHAHSLERISSLKVSHGLAVLFGLLVDIRLSGALMQQYQELLEACRSTKVFDSQDIAEAACRPEADWRIAYFSDPKDQHLTHDEICYLNVKSCGCFAEPSVDFDETNVKRIAWDDFWIIFLNVIRDISAGNCET